MTALAYSELLKRIMGIEDKELESPFKILNKNNTTPKRLIALKTLAKNNKLSLGKTLDLSNFPAGGGSYLNLRKYFLILKKEGLLDRQKENGKEVWFFSEKGEILKKFISN